MSSDDEVPASRFRRAQIASRAGLRAGTHHLVHGLKRMVQGERDDQASREARDEEIARIIFEALSQLRGMALKAAQLLCMELEILPEPMRRKLGRSFYQVPPLSPAMSRSLVMSELGSMPELLFSHFEAEAFAAASLGQVHRATGKGGEPLAIKLQYPGVATSLSSDMRMIRGLVKVLPLDNLVRPQVLNRTLRDIEDRLQEEIDYELEAENSRWFGQAFADWERLKIPRVYDQFTTSVVLCTERIEGRHIDEWLEKTRPSQELRDHFGQIITDFFYHCIYRLHRVHADPNPGNFIFMEDGRLGIIDFGCVQSFEPSFIRDMRASTQGYIDNDLDAALAAYERLGLLPVERTESALRARRERFRKAREYVSKIFGAETFDFSTNAGLVTESQKEFGDSLGIVENVPRGLSYYNRAFSGMMRMLEQMGARVCLRPPPLEQSK